MRKGEKIKRRKGIKSVTPTEFFKLIAINARVTDLETVKNIYYGLVRTMGQELTNRHVIKLPDWGVFSLKFIKERMIVDLNSSLTKGKMCIGPKLVVKFKPCEHLKLHFILLGEEGTK